VTDAAIVMSVISAPDARDVYAWPTPPVYYTNSIEDGVRGLRIAYSPRLGYVRRVDPEVEAAVAKAARAFEGLGAKVEQADPDIGGDPVPIWNTLWWSTMDVTLAVFGDRARQLADPGLPAGAAQGAGTSAADYMRAQLKRAELHNIFVRFHERYDLLLTPSLPLPAFEAGHLVPPDGTWGSAWSDWAPFSYPFNLTQQPAASVPCGFTKAGLPIGLQIVGPIGADDKVLRAARAYETTAPFAMLAAPRQA
jgi:aspartyl-tRNA(Asn)/glutamyl-tRNA(Gln) amidotransferase subunit A